MSTITQRKKLSKGTWLLILLLGIALIILIVLHFTYQAIGFGVDLSFLGGIATGLMDWGATGGWNATIVLVLPFVLGALALYTLKAYFIGEKVTGAIGAGQPGYAPTPTYPTQSPQSGKETTIS